MNAMPRRNLPRIVLGRIMTRLRIQAGLNRSQATTLMPFGRDKLCNIEDGAVRVTAFDIQGMAEKYGAPADVIAELKRLAEAANEPEWWRNYLAGMLEDFSMFLELEQSCRAIRIFEPTFITGLLQTDGYARAVHEAHPLSSGTDQAVNLRMLRQQRFWGRTPLPVVELVMHEHALSLPIGDETNRAAQRERIRQVAALPEVDVRILPVAAGAHPSMKGAYQIMEFTEPEVSDVVYLETVEACHYVEEMNALASYHKVFTATKDMAIPFADFLADP